MHECDPPAGLDGAPSPGRTLRLLYVEDDRLNAILFEVALHGRPGLELRLAVDADDALVQVQGWQPDLLVLDSHLPGMNGFDLLLLLRDQPGLAGVPAIMCSADASPDDLLQARDAGFSGFWPKPIDVEQVLRDLQHLAQLAAQRPAGL